MLRVERAGKRLLAFDSLQARPMADFYDLTDFIVNSPREFFGEIGEDLFVVGVNVPVAPKSTPVDLLAVDSRGAAVAAVIETSAEESSLSRAIMAAGRIASWSADDFWKRLSAARTKELKAFLGTNIGNLNHRQRVIVIGETPDDELLSVASWLRKRGVDILAVRTAFAVDPITGAEYLRCTRDEPHFEQAQPEPEPIVEQKPKAAAAGATAPAAGPPVGFDERRSHQREEGLRARSLRVEYAGRRMSAALADYSSGGVGLHMHSPLPNGARVSVSGELQTPSGSVVELGAAGRIRHCRFGEKAFRLGVAFDQAAG